jgi:hypothetical protein
MKIDPGCFIFAVLLILMMAFVGFGATNYFRPHLADPQNESIYMVQPNGWNGDRDQQYAEHVNEPNARANEDNAHANLYNAQATKTVAEASDVGMQNGGGAYFYSGIAYATGWLCIGGLVLFGLFFLGIKFG